MSTPETKLVSSNVGENCAVEIHLLIFYSVGTNGATPTINKILMMYKTIVKEYANCTVETPGDEDFHSVNSHDPCCHFAQCLLVDHSTKSPSTNSFM
jgi:hypothetical protein